MDVKLVHSYIGAAFPVVTRSHDCEYCHNYLLPVVHGYYIYSLAHKAKKLLRNQFIDSYLNTVRCDNPMCNECNNNNI